MHIRQFLRQLLKYFGIIAFKQSSRVYVPEGDSYRIIAGLVQRPDPMIIDGGSHSGDMVQSLGLLLPGARFHCFEPDPVLGDTLQRRYADNSLVNINKTALGSSIARLMLNINVSRPTNSLLQASEFLPLDLEPLSRPVSQVEVAVISIDEYCAIEEIDTVDIIKLDLQGYDYIALTGAARTLINVKIVLVEVLFKELYKDCHLFPDTLNFLLEKGFDLYSLCGLHYGPDDELLWADAIFLRNDVSSRSK